MEGERRKRVVFTISGSNHDGPQMLEGLKILSVALRGQVIQDLEPSGRLPKIEEIGDGHYIISCHRNPETLAGFLNMIADAAKQEANTDFVLVMGAGWAAALPGVAAGYLYHHHGAKNVFVVAAAFESNPKGKESITPRGSEQFVLNSVRTALEILAALNAKQRRDLAAILSILELPGNLTIHSDSQGVFFGADGFKRACEFAVNGEIPGELQQKIAGLEKRNPEWRGNFESALAYFTQQAAPAA